jgi:alkylated DNA repair dioxygenase AlkB
MENFDDVGFKLVRYALDSSVLKLLQIQFDMLRNTQQHEHRNQYQSFGDSTAPKSYSCYAPQCFESLLPYLHADMERITGKTLLPSYSYARIYYTGADLPKHKDRPSCEYSITLCIKNDTVPWPIWFQTKDGKDVSVELNEGDMVIYKGPEILHWRETFAGKEMMQCFLHYVDANGEYKNYYKDGRPMLGLKRPK